MLQVSTSTDHSRALNTWYLKLKIKFIYHLWYITNSIYMQSNQYVGAYNIYKFSLQFSLNKVSEWFSFSNKCIYTIYLIVKRSKAIGMVLPGRILPPLRAYMFLWSLNSSRQIKQVAACAQCGTVHVILGPNPAVLQERGQTWPK